METLLSVLALITLAVFIRAAIDIQIGKRRISRLHAMAKVDPANAPRVSVIIPACNEEENIQDALESVLTQDYPNLQVITVNDRSSDQTGAILDRMAASHPMLKIVTITVLPSNWLGKNNALHTGASNSAGEWLLFADADVVMDQSAIARAVRYAIDHDVDHLAIAPRAVVGGFLAKVFLA